MQVSVIFIAVLASGFLNSVGAMLVDGAREGLVVDEGRFPGAGNFTVIVGGM